MVVRSYDHILGPGRRGEGRSNTPGGQNGRNRREAEKRWEMRNQAYRIKKRRSSSIRGRRGEGRTDQRSCVVQGKGRKRVEIELSKGRGKEANPEGGGARSSITEKVSSENGYGKRSRRNVPGAKEKTERKGHRKERQPERGA